MIVIYFFYIARQRHLLNDLAVMMPHGRKDVKFDSKSSLNTLNELAELYNCNNVLFFEARKAQDLYVWMSKVPNGPTIKFHAQNSMCHYTYTLSLSSPCCYVVFRFNPEKYGLSKQITISTLFIWEHNARKGNT